MKKIDKKILVLGGGVLQGVFGAGVITTLEKNNTYNNIEAIYGLSAGAFNASYFLTNQSELGASIYYDDLSKKFLSSRYFFYAIIQRLRRKNPKKKLLISLI